MPTRYLFVSLMIAAIVSAIMVGGILLQTPALAQDAETAEPAPAETKASPVVAAVPYQTRTEYQMDPFEPSRMRSTETEVSTLILVRADGSTEIVRAR